MISSLLGVPLGEGPTRDSSYTYTLHTSTGRSTVYTVPFLVIRYTYTPTTRTADRGRRRRALEASKHHHETLLETES